MSANEQVPTRDVDNTNARSVAGSERTIAEFISDDVVTVAPETTLREAARALRNADVSLAIVTDGHRVNGVLSERDIVAAIAVRADLDEQPVGTMDVSTLQCATPESTVAAVAEEMLAASVRHIVVRGEDGMLAGAISMRDILAAYVG